MSYYLNQSNEKFLRYTKNKVFVDKSLLIKECNDVLGSEDSYMCITRPRRFGKTMALSMLNAYYSKGCDSKELFKKLKISNVSSFDTHLNKHNVIWIDMQSVYKDLKDKSSFVDELHRTIINDLNTSFPNILTSEEITSAKAFRKINNELKENFILLIDEWDVVLRESNDKILKNNYIDLLLTLFKAGDTSSCFDLVYMTGILPIKRYDGQSSLNCFKEYTMLDSESLASYVGFTADEVENLCNDYNMDYNKMKKWYDGYNVNGQEIYNPKSVVEAITKREYDDYWASTSSINPVVKYLSYEDKDLKEELTNMLADIKIKSTIKGFDNDIREIHSKSDCLILLIHLGYLTFEYGSDRTKDVNYYIPNYEIRSQLINALKKLKWYDLYEPINDSEEAVNALYNHDEETISKILDKNHNLYANSLNKNNEQVLELLTILSFSTLRSTHEKRNQPSNTKGRADIIYIPKYNDPAIIVELKYNKNASLAIDQIKNKEYISLLDNYHGKVILCGINYDDNMKHTTKIEEIEI